ncbi:ABC transporter ATP-binding protein [Bradyrhizobium sp. U87765 SZCCT0131]|uniref:ABC transporter ATP-binding protein n=1 Tax=unclassified Bradyrhizobium TaxID=2631580 RepID=UPI001BACA385|nr:MULTISPECIES: ATP-binding cassette domain-containing protein [unclassified Bradyrhizobium]MBR1217721.1 ABC transporter ATP-binding protein [Bradyrhizobium sp. U87765 SZCCT0131]MBR1261333.1 ABC transporter ATP-binding protein [Bradyrhizobium sp. U87765 SZCCT0134]MBR1303219.1 ABC transporter ATP-binding protein [Bradyrhizobium sp. U87765 SZCCT0110]MBR1318825.1 ABC transporter ATP-binding protein [Bradyrhizobium sp. U87765 SZCCT0109]MBR1347150.1 ABC transporter ATP-binding protein [Bradyrhizob
MIRIRDVTVQFGAVRPLEALSADLAAPIVGLIGPNGAGKTTLLNVLSGFVRPRQGAIDIDGTNLLALTPTRRVAFGLRRTFQTEQIADDLTAWDNVLAIADHMPRGGSAPEEQVERALHYVGLGSVAQTLGAALNLFERRLLEIAKALVGKPRLILMDEPAAGLNEAESMLLKQRIVGIPSTFGAQILLIDHDVDLIAVTCTETLVLDFGKRLALGPTRAVLDEPVVREAYLGNA